MKEDPRLVEKALPSQEMERQFSMLREVTLKPVSVLPDHELQITNKTKETLAGISQGLIIGQASVDATFACEVAFKHMRRELFTTNLSGRN